MGVGGVGIVKRKRGFLSVMNENLHAEDGKAEKGLKSGEISLHFCNNISSTPVVYCISILVKAKGKQMSDL